MTRPAGVGGASGAKTKKKGEAKQLGSAAASPQGGAAGALPEGAAKPSELLERKGHAERALTRSVKVLAKGPSGQLVARDIGVRDEDGEPKMVEADKNGEDQLVDLPGPIQVAETERRINGIVLAPGESFILLA